MTTKRHIHHQSHQNVIKRCSQHALLKLALALAHATSTVPSLGRSHRLLF